MIIIVIAIIGIVIKLNYYLFIYLFIYFWQPSKVAVSLFLRILYLGRWSTFDQ